MWVEGDTIAAIATPKGHGALGIVRISGPETSFVVSRCFQSKIYDPKESHRAFYGLWKDPASDKAVDEVVVLNFTQGKGFTGESSCEVICHGGQQVVQMVLDSILASGVRQARPGEFTYRAVMNNRMDLSQAEAILDLIAARSPQAAQLALVNIQGGLSTWLTQTEECLTGILANLEASIDFTTEDIQPFDYPELSNQVKTALASVSKILDTHVNTQVISQGLRVALVGKPNVGKSSLLNSLVGRQRSIVTSEPGTTRDTVEVDILINQNLVSLIDTAGIRNPEGLVESLGIEKTQNEIRDADVVVYVVDGSQGIQNEDVEIWKSVGFDRLILCFNKSDLKKIKVEDVVREFGLSRVRVVETSALESQGVESLRESFGTFFNRNVSPDIDAVISTSRQREGLIICKNRLEKSWALLNERASQELVSLEMTEALAAIQSVLGKTPNDDVLNRVFKDFCIGK